MRQIGSLKIRVCQEWSEGRVRSLEVYHGWTSINGKKKTECNSSKTDNAELHLLVKVEPDPRFLFCFDGDPVLSSQIVQTLGNCKQPIFSCKFSRDRSSRSGYEFLFLFLFSFIAIKFFYCVLNSYLLRKKQSSLNSK